MAQFKKSSIAFQRGDLDCKVYLTTFRQTFGDVASRLYFSELLLLLPDEGKREELQNCYDEFNHRCAAPLAVSQSSAPPSTWSKKANQPQRPW